MSESDDYSAPVLFFVFFFNILNGVWISRYLTGPLQIAKVDVGDEEDRLGLQVRHGLEEGGVGLLRDTYHTRTSVLP